MFFLHLILFTDAHHLLANKAATVSRSAVLCFSLLCNGPTWKSYFSSVSELQFLFLTIPSSLLDMDQLTQIMKVTGVPGTEFIQKLDSIEVGLITVYHL